MSGPRRLILQNLFGLKWNPFLADIPARALSIDSALQSFLARMEHLCDSGGYALVTGAPGTGKSAALRVLEHRLSESPELQCVILTRPQCSVNDFSRELGDLFAIRLNPCNRWGGSKLLRERWLQHVQESGKRAVVLLDEAQEAQDVVLNELRLMSSSRLDSMNLLTVVLAGDERLGEHLRGPRLLPIASRVRVRLQLGPKEVDVLREILVRVLEEAGAKALVTPEVLDALATHAGGNLRVMMHLAAELLEAAVRLETERIDAKLFHETFDALAATVQGSARRTRRASRGTEP